MKKQSEETPAEKPKLIDKNRTPKKQIYITREPRLEGYNNEARVKKVIREFRWWI